MLKKEMLAPALSTAMVLSLLAGCSASQETETTAATAAAEGTTETQTEAETAETAEKATITVAYHPHITGVGGLLNAIDNGYFDEENLEVELIQFTSGATELQAMASGEIDIGYLGVGAHVLRPRDSA